MDRGKFRLLVQLFSRRFFENDLLAPDIDLRPSAIWLLPALAAPAFLWTIKRAVPYSLMSVHGYRLVEVASWLDKSLLMALAMAGAGVVTVLVWEALLVDRRDAFVLGSLPIQPRMVVAAKALAVLRVFAVIAALNLPSVLLFSLEVYGNFGGTLILRSLVAHAVAATAASLSTSAILGVSLVAVTSFLDGRALRVMTVVVQTLVVAALTGLILGTQWAPVVGAAALQGDAAVLGRMAAWPPAWFVGLYQVILAEGPGQEVFSALMGPALVTTLVALGVCAPATLLLWRRSLKVLVSAAPGEAPGQAWSLARSLPRWLARPPLDRAFIQFFVAVIWRSPRHRLAALAAAGLAFAIGLEGMLTLTVRVPTNSRWLTEFAVPLLALLCLLSVFRWLLTLPAELPASWVMGLVTPASGATVRRAVGRLFLALVVAPPTLMAFALSWWQGGLTSALAHGALMLLIGLGLVEHALTRVTFMPFATEYLPGRSNLKARWPIHVAVLVFVVPAVAQLERALVVAPGVAFAVAATLAIVGIGLAMYRRGRGTDGLSADPGPGEEWKPVQLRIGWV